MDWVVFGDDWGAHPSTTQHLVRHLPVGDRVLWVDSLGMRAPRLQVADLRRLARKARALATPRVPAPASPRAPARLHPAVLPWHLHPAARRLNGASLRRALRARLAELGPAAAPPAVLASNPVAAWYLDTFFHGRVGYLRLDDYARLPGVDPALARAAEAAMVARADAVFAPAEALLPPGLPAGRGHYLPQGVDLEHFARVPLAPPRRRVLGFFGLVAEWLDLALVAAVARALPDWTLELRGPVRHLPAEARALPNVRWLPAVPYEALPDAIAGWSAAWIPFVVDPLTRSVNPLKAREYLAAGLAVCGPPLPEIERLAARADVRVAADPGAVAAWLREVEATDTEARRLARRESVAADGWGARAAELRAALEAP